MFIGFGIGFREYMSDFFWIYRTNELFVALSRKKSALEVIT
jgi:hypothetical protein